MKIFFDKDTMRDAHIDVRICDDRQTKMHSHSFFEIVYVLEGSAEHTINGHSMILHTGDYFLINLKSKHQYVSIGDTCDFKVINCLFEPEFIDKTLEGAHSFAEILNNYLVKFGYNKFTDRLTNNAYHDSDGFLRSVFLKMQEEYKDKASGWRDVIRSLLVTLLIFLARNDTEADEGGALFVRHIKEHVAENYMNEVNLSDIARDLHISLTYASVIFKGATGMTFRDYLLKFRIEKACDLLRISDKTIAEIAELVGYTDAAFFYKVFKRRLGLTPSEYRVKQKQS